MHPLLVEEGLQIRLLVSTVPPWEKGSESNIPASPWLQLVLCSFFFLAKYESYQPKCKSLLDRSWILPHSVSPFQMEMQTLFGMVGPACTQMELNLVAGGLWTWRRNTPLKKWRSLTEGMAWVWKRLVLSLTWKGLQFVIVFSVESCNMLKIWDGVSESAQCNRWLLWGEVIFVEIVCQTLISFQKEQIN